MAGRPGGAQGYLVHLHGLVAECQCAGKRTSEPLVRAVAQLLMFDLQFCPAVFCRRLDQRIIHRRLLSPLLSRAT